MSHGEKVFCPDGKTRMYFKGEGQTWKEIIESVILPRWEEYCDRAWLSANHEDIFAPEKRVKWFLDKLCYLMCLDDPGGVLTPAKEMTVRAREFSLSDCPQAVTDMVYGTGGVLLPDNANPDEWLRFKALQEQMQQPKRKKRVHPRGLTRFEKLEKIRKVNPNRNFEWLRVDAENCFEWRGARYRIRKDVPAYNSIDTSEGQFSNIDSILVVHKNGVVEAFYDAGCNLLQECQIYKTEPYAIPA